MSAAAAAATATTAAAVLTSTTTKRLMRIGMIGGGTVGGGVYELINKYHNDTMIITKICVKSLDKPRDFVVVANNTTNNTTTFVTDASTIYNDPTIDCIVEVMGGITLAKDIVLNSIASGKSVVTANKALLAEYLDEINTAVINANKTTNNNKDIDTTTSKKVTVGYEASVCGGIPIINILRTTYTSDTISCIMGICNGTTNYMLTEMYYNGTPYNDVLAVAQELGYAEADPTADVEGHDVRSKISILAKLAYGCTISNPSLSIPCKGISQITLHDIHYAKHNNYTIKLLGFAKRNTNTNTSTSSLSVYVTPALIPLSHMIGTINGSGNCVAITSNNMGPNPCIYAGPGAGRYPTANSVVSDLVQIYNNTLLSPPFPTISISKDDDDESNLQLNPNYTASFYIRINYPTTSTNSIVLDETTINNIATDVGISIVSSGSLVDNDDVYVVTTAANTPVTSIETFVSSITVLFTSFTSSSTPPTIFFMPILECIK